MDGLVEQDGQPVVMEYGTKAEYTAKAKGGVLSYLNNTFLTSLNSYLTYLVENEWYYGAHEDVQGSYSPLDNYANTYKSYVSIPNNSYLFLADQKDYFLNTMSASTDKLIYTVSNDNLLYADLLENQHHIRAVICMNGQTRLLSGSGTPEDPYIVESPAQPEVN
jgi:hypothetical protein